MRHHPSRISKKSARVGLQLMLDGCRPERLTTLTLAELEASWNVPSADIQQMLAQARAGRGM